MHFADKLLERVEKKDSPLCIGLDPHLEHLPGDLITKYRATCEDIYEVYACAAEEFLLRIIDRISEQVAVVKPQFAFFERMGVPGLRVLSRISKEASARGLIVIGDAKRCDIGSTAQAYAQAYFRTPLFTTELPPYIPLDAITLSPYMGVESIEPFLSDDFSRGVFVLVKTSNPSGAEIQDLSAGNSNVAGCVAELVNSWAAKRNGEYGYADIGAVVGAPYPEEAIRLRKIMPNSLFLIPGYGFQGGTAHDAVASFDENGFGGIINSSRGIVFAYRSKEYAKYGSDKFEFAAEEACRKSIQELRDALNSLYT